MTFELNLGGIQHIRNCCPVLKKLVFALIGNIILYRVPICCGPICCGFICCGPACIDNGFPQAVQNFVPSLFSVLHLGHIIIHLHFFIQNLPVTAFFLQVLYTIGMDRFFLHYFQEHSACIKSGRKEFLPAMKNHES